MARLSDIERRDRMLRGIGDKVYSINLDVVDYRVRKNQPYFAQVVISVKESMIDKLLSIWRVMYG